MGNQVCKENTDLQSWDTDLKAPAEENAKYSLTAGGGSSIDDSLKQITRNFSQSITETVQEILALKDDATKGKGSSTKKKKNEKRVNMLADECMKNSSNMLDFLSEMEKFLTLARDSYSYITTLIEKYFKIRNGMRGRAATLIEKCFKIQIGMRDRAKYHRMIVDNLKKLRDSDDTFGHSALKLLKKAESLKSQHEETLQKLQGEHKKLCRKEKGLKMCKKVLRLIFDFVMFGFYIVWNVASVTSAPYVAFAKDICFTGIALFEEPAKDIKYKLEVNKARCKETRVSIKALGDLKPSINDVITQIDSAMYKPSSEMEHIVITMEEIRKKLGAFLKKVEVLQIDFEKARTEIRTARDDVFKTCIDSCNQLP